MAQWWPTTENWLPVLELFELDQYLNHLTNRLLQLAEHGSEQLTRPRIDEIDP